jgi:hypothetical protein
MCSRRAPVRQLQCLRSHRGGATPDPSNSGAATAHLRPARACACTPAPMPGESSRRRSTCSRARAAQQQRTWSEPLSRRSLARCRAASSARCSNTLSGLAGLSLAVPPPPPLPLPPPPPPPPSPLSSPCGAAREARPDASNGAECGGRGLAPPGSPPARVRVCAHRVCV